MVCLSYNYLKDVNVPQMTYQKNGVYLMTVNVVFINEVKKAIIYFSNLIKLCLSSLKIKGDSSRNS